MIASIDFSMNNLVRMKLNLNIVLFALILMGCGSNSSSTLSTSSLQSETPTSLISSSTGVSESSNVQFYESILYGNDPRQILELAHRKDVVDPQPAVLFIHGGSWIGGDKAIMRRYQDLVLDNGYIYISMNYRFITTGADYLDMLDDITLALSFIKDYANDLMVNPAKIALVGESAGAHLAMLYAFRNKAISPIEISFVMAMVPPVDFTDPAFITYGDPTLQLFLANGLMGTSIEGPESLALSGYPSSWVDASPISHLNQAIPTLIAYAGMDELIPLSNMERCIQRATELNAPLETIFFENSGHSLSSDPDKLALLLTTFILRLNQYL
jgi:acetyl esterase/lipase